MDDAATVATIPMPPPLIMSPHALTQVLAELIEPDSGPTAYDVPVSSRWRRALPISRWRITSAVSCPYSPPNPPPPGTSQLHHLVSDQSDLESSDTSKSKVLPS